MDLIIAVSRGKLSRLAVVVVVWMGLFVGCGEEEFSEEEEGPPVQEVEKPTALPEIRLYSDQSPFNQKIPPDAELDPDSDRYIAALAGTLEHVTIQVGQYSAPVYFADEQTPRHDVLLACGPEWEIGVSVLEAVPIPDYAEPADDRDGEVPLEGCAGSPDKDNNMVVIDLVNRCEYDFWQMRRENGQWVASWGNALSIDGSGVFEQGLSARGSGFAFLAGVIWPHELRQGEIPHALIFNLPERFVRDGGPVPPATESDGISWDPAALPEGARLRLDPTLDLEALPMSPVERTIARAMQEYGLFLSDIGGGQPVLALYAVDPAKRPGKSI
ncbi:MAG: hypothetical protein KatS3mg115_2442 [Candidatus Poribacteria bacterium]|nr:MAG: hypothetical protein KatS3mg115_2442 [Candidatus Poribacteria bacterium]